MTVILKSPGVEPHKRSRGMLARTATINKFVRVALRLRIRFENRKVTMSARRVIWPMILRTKQARRKANGSLPNKGYMLWKS